MPQVVDSWEIYKAQSVHSRKQLLHADEIDEQLRADIELEPDVFFKITGNTQPLYSRYFDATDLDVAVRPNITWPTTLWDGEYTLKSVTMKTEVTWWTQYGRHREENSGDFIVHIAPTIKVTNGVATVVSGEITDMEPN